MLQVPGAWIHENMFDRLIQSLQQAPLIDPMDIAQHVKVFPSFNSDRSKASLRRRAKPLTRTESAIVQDLADGLKMKEIAAKHGLTYPAVQEHMSRARYRTGCATTGQLVARAVAANVVSVLDPLQVNNKTPLKLVVTIAGHAQQTRGRRALVGRLTELEVRTLELMAEGKEYKEIASAFRVSLETVKTRMRIIRRKLGAKNAAHAVALAHRNGALG